MPLESVPSSLQSGGCGCPCPLGCSSMFQVNFIHSYLLGSGQLGKEISNVQYSNFTDRASWVVAGLGMNHVFCLTMLMAV